MFERLFSRSKAEPVREDMDGREELPERPDGEIVWHTICWDQEFETPFAAHS